MILPCVAFFLSSFLHLSLCSANGTYSSHDSNTNTLSTKLGATGATAGYVSSQALFDTHGLLRRQSADVHVQLSNNQTTWVAGSNFEVPQRIVGYYEGWKAQGQCGKMPVANIPVDFLTHLVFAYGFISTDFRITNMPGVQVETFGAITDLKQRSPSLKVMIALGGWTFNGTLQPIFSGEHGHL